MALFPLLQSRLRSLPGDGAGADCDQARPRCPFSDRVRERRAVYGMRHARRIHDRAELRRHGCGVDEVSGGEAQRVAQRPPRGPSRQLDDLCVPEGVQIKCSVPRRAISTIEREPAGNGRSGENSASGFVRLSHASQCVLAVTRQLGEVMDGRFTSALGSVVSSVKLGGWLPSPSRQSGAIGWMVLRRREEKVDSR